eukprot:1082323-Pyramimonas_sp.AAC.1
MSIIIVGPSCGKSKLTSKWVVELPAIFSSESAPRGAPLLPILLLRSPSSLTGAPRGARTCRTSPWRHQAIFRSSLQIGHHAHASVEHIHARRTIHCIDQVVRATPNTMH